MSCHGSRRYVCFLSGGCLCDNLTVSRETSVLSYLGSLSQYIGNTYKCKDTHTHTHTHTHTRNTYTHTQSRTHMFAYRYAYTQHTHTLHSNTGVWLALSAPTLSLCRWRRDNAKGSLLSVTCQENEQRKRGRILSFPLERLNTKKLSCSIFVL